MGLDCLCVSLFYIVAVHILYKLKYPKRYLKHTMFLECDWLRYVYSFCVTSTGSYSCSFSFSARKIRMAVFHIADYVVFVVVLVISLGIGVFFSFRQKSTSEYFMGGRQLKLFPVTISIAATITSAHSLLGTPAEVRNLICINIVCINVSCPVESN